MQPGVNLKVKRTNPNLTTLRLLAFLGLSFVALPSAAGSCGGTVNFTELFATPDPHNRMFQALIVKNVGTKRRGDEVEVLDKLTPGTVEDRIVIFGADGVSCKGPIVREPRGNLDCGNIPGGIAYRWAASIL